MNRWLSTLKTLWDSDISTDNLQSDLERLRKETPIPVFWLLGRTQSGKSSLVRYLTGAEEAEVGSGFRPCTRVSREYSFPTAETPLLKFLDTRGLDEPDYDPGIDIEKFRTQAHLVIVTARVMDHAQDSILQWVRRIHKSAPSMPIILVLTCLHEAYPGQQHPLPYPFTEETLYPETASRVLVRAIEHHQSHFRDLVSDIVPVDLTRPQEGFHEPNYGGEELRRAILRCLPQAYRRNLLALDEATGELKDLYLKHAIPTIQAFSAMASTAGAAPIPFLDMVTIPAIQGRMVMQLAKLYGQELTGRQFLEIAGSVGMGMLTRQASRQLTKFVPGLGSVVGATLAGASTFALGRAFCYYYQTVHEGHIPNPETLKAYYSEQLSKAESFWRKS